jgi:alpha-tubulin suppressor-like RCC1 family protein
MRRLRLSLPALTCATALLACESAPPLAPVPVEEPFTAISAAGYTTCALTVGGSAFCWGRGTSGQLGNGGADNQGAPVPVQGGRRFSAIAAGYYHACALESDGQAWCWGAAPRADNAGQLGNGSESSGSTVPVAVRTSIRFRDITAGQMHTCGLAVDGQAYCWGSNEWGQVGDGTTRNRTVPVAVSGDHRFISLSAGAAHTCGATTAGQVLCWGDNFFGAVTGSALTHTPDTCEGGDLRCTLVPHAVDVGAAVQTVSGGDTSTCALAQGGAWYCWGGGAREAAPPRLVRATGIASLSTGLGHWCGVAPEGAAWCRGGNDLGQLGTDGPADFAPSPLPVAGGLTFRVLATGMFHTCGISADGFAWCWGSNHYEALGGAGATSTCGSETCRRAPGRVRGQHSMHP